MKVFGGSSVRKLAVIQRSKLITCPGLEPFLERSGSGCLQLIRNEYVSKKLRRGHLVYRKVTLVLSQREHRKQQLAYYVLSKCMRHRGREDCHCAWSLQSPESH
jgi:hypothetical protein